MEEIDFSTLMLPDGAKISQKENVFIIEKWSWEYSEFLIFQKSFQEFVRVHRKAKIYIFTNHPHCFTTGRGNERGVSELEDFKPHTMAQLEFPVHQIHRGGGITFHYPGQWIFYPIVALNPNYTLADHMCWLLKIVREFLTQEFDLKAIATQKIMGVWIEKRKIASIGVGLNRFVTEHGVAFNINKDPQMERERLKIHPCGLSAQTYTFLNEELSVKPLDIQELHYKLLKSII